MTPGNPFRRRRVPALKRPARRIALVTTCALLLGASVTACAPSTPPSPTASPAPSAPARGSSPVVIRLVSPTNGEVVHGSTLHVVVAIDGGTIVQTASNNTDPRVGHVHLYMENRLIYMSYTLSQDVPVSPGLTYTMYAEWVGADHFPFSPRDATPTVVFTVAPS